MEDGAFQLRLIKRVHASVSLVFKGVSTNIMAQNRALTVIVMKVRRRPRSRQASLIHGGDCSQINAFIHRLLLDNNIQFVVDGMLARDLLSQRLHAGFP
jgi:hypothetical protein